jgi:hypothetical protein
VGDGVMALADVEDGDQPQEHKYRADDPKENEHSYSPLNYPRLKDSNY